MKKLIVLQGVPHNPSPETIVDELCTTQRLCEERGRAYLYDVAWDKLVLSLTLKIPKEFTCGDVVQFYDPDVGNMVKGRVTSWNNQCSVNAQGLLSYDQSVSVEREVL